MNAAATVATSFDTIAAKAFKGMQHVSHEEADTVVKLAKCEPDLRVNQVS